MNRKHAPRRQAFADEVVQAIQELAEKHGLDDVEVHRNNPVLIAVRGCLRGDDAPDEPIEMVTLVSDDLRQAEAISMVSRDINQQGQVAAPSQVHRSFDISEAVATETASGGAGIEPESPCD